MKSILRRIIRRFTRDHSRDVAPGGYVAAGCVRVEPAPTNSTAESAGVGDLPPGEATHSARVAWDKAMRAIRMQDAVQIEFLLRSFVLPNLPPRPGREQLLTRLIGTSVSEGLYIVDALKKSLTVPGDICEFGVAQGATSALLANEIINTNRHLYLFDSFEGLPPPTKEDVLINDIFGLGSIERYAGQMREPEAEVLQRLDEIPFPEARRHIMKGWVNETIRRSDAPQCVAFAYVDLDFYLPIVDVLAFLDCCTEPGAYIVVDDYGFFSAGAQRAVDEFVDTRQGRWKLQKPLNGLGQFVILRRE